MQAHGRTVRHNHTGFSLVELSALIVVVAMAMSTILSISQSSNERKTQTNVIDKRSEIITAINAYLERNGRYPCVAGYTDLPNASTFGREIMADCTASSSAPMGTQRVESSPGSGSFIRIGAVPTFDLLLPDEYMNDGFGNRYTYAVMEGLTKSATYADTSPAIQILDGTGTAVTTTAAYTVFSHGKDGKGAYRVESGVLKEACGASSSLDVENCDGDASFRLAEFDATTDITSQYHDDFLKFQPKATIPGTTSAPAFTGFRLDGAAANEYSGWLVSAGDVNNDGFDDVIIGAVSASPQGRIQAGSAYVIFGSLTGLPTPLDLLSLNGSNGFRLNGVAMSDNTGSGNSTGDINNDGFDDIIVGAYNASPGGRSYAGSAYVVFGKASGWPASVELSSLDGTNGFRLNGVAMSDRIGASVSVGDVNNDGFDDILISAQYADPGGRSDAGSVYVVFGKASGWPASVELSSLDGTNGFRLDGVAAGDTTGYSVSTGDVNNDGFADILLSAKYASPGGRPQVGSAYVVFGKANGWATAMELSSLNGTNGFQLNGIVDYDRVGDTISSGDINNDGFADILIGAPSANPGGRAYAGSAFIVFGKASGWGATMELSSLNGTNGFRFDGAVEGDSTGYPVEAGDVNNDGFDDLLVGVNGADPGGVQNAGAAFVVFGKASGWSATIEPSTLNGTNGFRLNGSAVWDVAGAWVSSGDVNNDGFADVLVGAWQAKYNVRGASGSTYGVYGKAAGWNAAYDLNTITVP